MVELLVYDRWGVQIGTIAPITCTRAEEVNGEDALTFTTTVHFDKGNRIVFQEESGVWREHIVTEVIEEREGSIVVATVIADNSICETNGDYVEDLRNQNMTAAAAMQKALSVTRWEQGATSSLGSNSQDFYHMSARAAVNAVAETWGGEVKTEISVGSGGVSRRRVSVVSRLGSNNYKRFEYKKDLVGITRHVETDDVVTALYGYGSGAAATDDSGEETGGFSRKTTFGDINGGKNYVEDMAALVLWGRPDGTLLPGGLAHVFGTVEFDDCEVPAELLALTKSKLPERTVPTVTYEATVQALLEAGFKYEGFALGDDVQIIDWAFAPALELQGRILRIEWNYRDPTQTVITLGNIVPAISDQLYNQAASLQNMKDHAGAWDKAATADKSYISAVIGTINAVMNATGGYVYMEPGEGITVYDRPADENPTMAIQLNGAGFRIANRKVGGEWQWRTFGTGDGFTADEITAGVIKGGANYWNLETGDLFFKQGGISDMLGKNRWNLDTGEFSLSANAEIGDSTASDLVVSTDVQYGVSDDAATQPASWTTTALWAKGKHLWTRVKMTLLDGSIQYTNARRIANDKGMGASEVIEQYYLSTSSTAQSGGSWLNSQPAWVNGRYYWTRSKITWSDGSITYTDAVLARALTSGNQATDDLDAELTQREIFNRLTNNGQTQGIYMSGNLLYINAAYLKTGVISDQAGRNTWNLLTGALTTNSIIAKGTFECGGAYGIKLNSTGQLAGYRNGSQVGYIDYSSSMRDVSTGAISYGIQVQCQGSMRFSTPKTSMAATSDTSVTATYGYTGEGQYVKEIHDNGNGTVGWSWREMRFINGFCTTI